MEQVDIKDYPDEGRMKGLVEKFAAKFDGAVPDIVVRVPGRVNLIGRVGLLSTQNTVM